MRRRGRSDKKERRARALVAQEHLANILQNPHQHPKEVVESAAVHLMKTSRRHRLHLSGTSRDLVCRACWSNHAFSNHFRVRIKDGQRIKTCLTCGSIRRFGGGPGHHRKQRKVES